MLNASTGLRKSIPTLELRGAEFSAEMDLPRVSLALLTVLREDFNGRSRQVHQVKQKGVDALRSGNLPEQPVQQVRSNNA